MTLGDIEVIGIMGRGYLDGAGAELGVDRGVGDYGNGPV